jgi:hypothetical protein
LVDASGAGGATREIDWTEQLARLKDLRPPASSGGPASSRAPASSSTPTRPPVARAPAEPPTMVRQVLSEQDRLLAAFLDDEDE